MSQTLLIDNYDSFTYNLYALIAEAGGEPPLVLRNDEVSWEDALTEDIARVVISPGPGRPQRRADLGLSADAILSGELPVLGVCLGHQAIGLLCGAKVGLASEPVHGRQCRVEHVGRDLFEGVPSPFHAVRYHSLAVTDLPAELEALAWSEDGTLMGLRHRSRPLWGVQFHPESIRTEHGAMLMRRFLDFTPSRRSMNTRSSRPPGFAPRASPTPSLRVHAVRIDTSASPCEIFSTLYAASDPAFWLDAELSSGEASRFSYMGDASGPRSEVLRYRSLDRRLELSRQGVRSVLHEDVFTYLQNQTDARRATASDVPFGFTGGYVGYFGYELKGELQGQHAAPAETPDACWLFADRVIAFDHEEHTTWLLCLDDHEGLCPQNRKWVEQTQRSLRSIGPGGKPEERGGSEQAAANGTFAWRHGPETYRSLIGSAMRSIREGESYEVCLTNQLAGTCLLAPFDVYRVLRRINPAPYSAFLRIGALSVMCSSPELFLKISTDGEVESRPIKGTARRDPDPVEDDRLAHELAHSVKNTSENLMIVDLLRNDLNRVCGVGSVHVPKIFAVERHATVHQLVSTVRGRLRADVTHMDCIRAAFPGGSMTGAPKVRTMAILDALERGPRGVYSGSLGYLSTNGSAQLNIVIRTLVMNGPRITMGTGGAIVALSDPQEEYSEILLKIGPLLRALQQGQAQASDETPREEPAPEESVREQAGREEPVCALAAANFIGT